MPHRVRPGSPRLTWLAFALALLAAAPALGAKVKVGAASRSVLPRVGGSYDYLAAGFPDRSDANDPGIPVAAWDDGRIAVGNGDDESYWVRDDLRTTAMALEDSRKKQIVVIVATDLYMVFRLDAEAIRSKAAALLGTKLAKKTRILVTATHNHHGPDTAFDVNHAWYEHMTDQVAAAVVEAVQNRRPAELRVAAGEHWFGAKDGTDPTVYDPRLNVLQAVDKEGQVIATAVQWNNHPEVTLGWAPPQDEISDDCALIGLADCDAEGRYFTSDYPGTLREDLQARYGGEVLYLSGALGVLVGPGGSQVWEVTKTHPLGNQLVAPAGAAAPGGGTDYTQRNFRRTAVIGEQLAAASIRLLDAAEKIKKPKVSYDVEPFYTRLSNFGFRVLLVVDKTTGRSSLGHAPAVLHVCPVLGPKTDDTCVEDGFAVLEEPALEISYRVGDHVKTAVEYVKIGTVGMMFLTGEIPGELTIGLPAGFRSEPEKWYAEAAGTHTFGADYQIPGYVLRRMKDKYKWTIGLGGDQLGYHVPISNFRVLCVADELIGPGTCALLHDEGYIDYPDSLSGAKCKALTEDPRLLQAIPAPARLFVAQSCRLGQALGEAQGHYEETNSAGWDLVEDMMAAVAAITKRDDPTDVNPDFPGWWQGLLPPGDLP